MHIELPVRAIADAIEADIPIELLAAVCGVTPVALVTASVQWLADHPDEFTNDEHARICALLATAINPDAPLGDPR